MYHLGQVLSSFSSLVTSLVKWGRHHLPCHRHSFLRAVVANDHKWIGLRQQKSVPSWLCRLGFQTSSHRHGRSVRRPPCLSLDFWCSRPQRSSAGGPVPPVSVFVWSQLCLIRVYSNSGWPHCFLCWDRIGLCHCVSLRYTMYWFDKLIYFTMITTVA